ncbi:MAG TPA: hypothetical protein VF219_19505 [Vicinamibacterales bacterium]
MANIVTLQTLIYRVRQRVNIEYAVGGNPKSITDTEIADHLNVSLANDVYDLVRQAVGDQYYRKTYTFLTVNGLSTYDLPGDHLSLVSVDAYLGTQIGDSAPKLNCRRYMEEERNLYSSLQLGWAVGFWVLCSLYGPNQIRFQPFPTAAYAIGLNYVPTSPQLGGSFLGQPDSALRYEDTWDDINGWSELAVLDAASKCALKLKQLDVAAYMDIRKDKLATKIKGLIPQRHAGEPERTHIYQRTQWGDGWENNNWGS